MEILKYLLSGILHYINLVLGILDFKDLGYMWVIIVGIIFFFIIDKGVRKAILSVIKSFFDIIKTIYGIIFLMLFIIYYVYIGLVFEDHITFGIFILSLYLFIQDFVRVNLNLLGDSKNTIIDIIKDISLPAILLCIQQIISMVEINDFSNLKLVLLSLMLIPIFSLLFIIFKHFVNFNEFYIRYERVIKFDDYYFFKIFSESLIKCGSYRLNSIVLSKFLRFNHQLDFAEMKKQLVKQLPQLIKETKLNEVVVREEKIVHTQLFKVFNMIWIINIICATYLILSKRFFDVDLGFTYYSGMITLVLYFWYDLMKIKGIKNQYDFVIYMFIYILLVGLILWYAAILKSFRLSELGFLIPIFVTVHARYYYKKFPSFLTLPKITKKNFFGVNPKDYI